MLWDRFVRVFHWSTATGFLANYFLFEAGGDTHEWVGYGLFALIMARIVWGFIGPKPARFKNFVPTPKNIRHAWQHFPEIYKAHNGHNAIGALMIYTLLLGLTLTAVTGWMQELDYFWGETWLEILHEWLANLVLAAVCIHVCAILLIQRLLHVPLVQSMTIKKR